MGRDNAVGNAVHRDREVDVSGIDNHEINGLKIVDATANMTDSNQKSLRLQPTSLDEGLCTARLNKPQSS